MKLKTFFTYTNPLIIPVTITALIASFIKDIPQKLKKMDKVLDE